MKIYIVTRNCCLGPCCSYGHKPNQPLRVEQLRTSDKSQAERTAEAWNTYPHNYAATITTTQENEA